MRKGFTGKPHEDEASARDSSPTPIDPTSVSETAEMFGVWKRQTSELVRLKMLLNSVVGSFEFGPRDDLRLRGARRNETLPNR